MSTQAKIIQGEDRTIKASIKTESGAAFDLTGVTEITACFKKSDNSYLSVTQTGGQIAIQGSAGAGEIAISLFDTDTELLALGNQSFEVLIDKGTERRIVQYVSKLNVVKRICV